MQPYIPWTSQDAPDYPSAKVRSRSQPVVMSHSLAYLAVLPEPVPLRLIKCSCKTEMDLFYPKRTVYSYGQPQTP